VVVARLVTLDELFEQLLDLRLDRLDGRPTLGSRPVKTPHRATGTLFPNLQEPTLLKAMQHRIQRARPDVVTMMPQLIDHSLTEYFTFRCVIHDVQRDQASAKGVIAHGSGSLDFGHAVSTK
jgi:hypothetical protein